MVRGEPWDEWNVFRMMHSKMYGSAEVVFYGHKYMTVFAVCRFNVYFSYLIQIVYSSVP